MKTLFIKKITNNITIITMLFLSFFFYVEGIKVTNATETEFSDIWDSFAKDDIIEFVNKWIIKWYDDNTFRPNWIASRGEFLWLVMKALWIQVDTSVTDSEFSDVYVDWMKPYILKAKDLWIISGQIMNWRLVFRPNDPITRAEALAILINSAKITIDSWMTNTEFDDVNVDWMKPYISKAKELWIISGQMMEWKLIFRPNDSITRAETTRIIKKVLDNKVDIPVINNTLELEILPTWLESNTLTINKWDTVRFVNKDDNLHWPASGPHPIHTWYPWSGIEKCGTSEQINIFDACRGLSKDETFSFTFNNVWEWAFHDHMNPTSEEFMWKIIVK